MFLHAVLVLDYRPLVGVVSEADGTVDICVYVCDNQLKRNATITVSFMNGSAQCEYPTIHVRTLHCMYVSWYMLLRLAS